MDINAIAENLEATAASEFLRSAFWFVPVLQSIHILAVCFVLTGFLLVFVRSWSIAGKDWSWSQWSDRLAPLLVYGFAALLITGIFQVMAEPTRELPNWLFQFKIALIILALPLAAILLKLFRNEDGPVLAVRLLSTIIAMVILVLVFAGRWIAYV